MRRGFALPFVIMIMAAVTSLTVASLTLATHEAVIAATQTGMTVATTKAAHGLRQLSHDWGQHDFHAMPVGATRTLVRSGAEISIMRTSWGTFHARATARLGQTTRVHDAVLRLIDLGWALGETEAAVSATGPVLAERAIIASDDTSRCTLPENVDAHRAIAPSPPGYAIGGVRWNELGGIADRLISGAVTWHQADTASTPLMFYSAADLEVVSGSASGLLLVDGNLVMRSAASFAGIIVVRGTATIHDGAYIFGALRIQGAGSSVIGAAQITHSRCASARALLDSPSSKRLIRAQRLFIPAFQP